MKIDICTLFPDMFDSVLNSSILARAIENDIMQIKAHNIRDYATNKHKQCDDAPFGGGAGMVMTVQPVFDCLDAVAQEGEEKRAFTIFLSPRGEKLSPKLAQDLAQKKRIVLLCGHYEGIDERILSKVDLQVSIGDYVLTGGELPAMVLIDALSRFVPWVLGSAESASFDSFQNGLLEHPQYTRPAEYCGMVVPDILLSGHHANIEKWRHEQSLLITAKYRPDLLKTYPLSKKDIEVLLQHGYDFSCEEY